MTARVDEVLATARSTVDRVGPEEALRLRAGGALLVDIRPAGDRAAEGEIPGAVPVERIHLEWRLDPSSEHRLPGVRPDRAVVVICNEGYASSLAAAEVKRLGLPGVTDLVGGFRAWRAAGLPTSGSGQHHLAELGGAGQ
ncbi:rhodanese-like domain-containing protein [Amycolatopsis cihanbeyliensis]|uniref:Rhodanese-related sulfurtransferase n=1 Tax=Amycolatopsis cihanbeyliensis TaxID=1128664 RepID=A0A542CUN1_AMYCI|nr:rhodanese-like domain-containing protein [Amycolatopsis cihanbeyliensis]TQI94523.1 rhodanese-related sulfurtransferase [Amycolatopsis cihanbeyliensis]